MASQQNRVELKTSARAPLPGARIIGPADANEKIELTLMLRRGSQPAAFPSIEQMGSRLPSQRAHLSREAFATTHAARGEDLAKIRAFASENGLEVIDESPARRSVTLGGTVQAFSDAFGVALSMYDHPSGRYRGRTGTLQIPAELDGVIEGVFGLDNRPQAMPHFRRRKEPAGGVRPQVAPASYTPLEVAQAYNFPAGTDGSGQCVAILELGGGYHAHDLQNYFKGLGITAPKVTAIKVDHGHNSPTNDPNGPDGEVALDIEIVGAVAPGAHIAVYFAPNTDRGFLDALTTAVHDTHNRPSIVSISWGGPETSWTRQAMNAFNSACQDAAAMGVTVLAASGDNGATDGDSNGNLTVDFPASSLYVLGCGGTKLTISGNRISAEHVWNELANNEGATGGGVSEVFAIPNYQKDAGVPTAKNGYAGRGVPDIAGDADPTTGYSVLVDGQTSVIGGTSAVAPLWSGLLARINQSLGASVGFLNPLLYTKNVESALHDITAGDNGGWSSGPGWDPCTGLGTPDGSALLTALGGKPASQQRAGTTAQAG